MKYKGLTVFKNGNIKGKKGKLVGWTNVQGYKMCSLDGKQVTIHSIIMKCFVGDRPEGYDINHKNGDKTDNRLCNLEYCTRQENIRHSFDTQLQVVPKGKDNHMFGKFNHWSSKKVGQYTMDGEFIREFPSVAEAGRVLGMKNPSNIFSVIAGRREHSFGYKWDFI